MMLSEHFSTPRPRLFRVLVVVADGVGGEVKFAVASPAEERLPLVAVNRSTGPCRSLESRTAVWPPPRATSTLPQS